MNRLCLILVCLSACGKVDIEPDAAGEDGQCAPESDSEVCTRLGKDCGSIVAVDNCGHERVVSCGSCTGVENCGGGGVANVCGEGECIPVLGYLIHAAGQIKNISLCNQMVNQGNDVVYINFK